LCRGCHIPARVAGYHSDEDGNRVEGERAGGLILVVFPDNSLFRVKAPKSFPERRQKFPVPRAIFSLFDK
jgi:hypothetical protein